MKTAHTPGPWTAETSWNDHARVCVTAKLGSFVSNNTRGIVCDTAHTPFLGQEKANARLIAASPALFDLLKEALAQSGCDGDLCAYEWHEKARRLLNEITEGNP